MEFLAGWLALVVCDSSIKNTVKRFYAVNFHCLHDDIDEVFHLSVRYNLYFMVTFMMNTLLMFAIYNFTMLCKCRISNERKSSSERRVRIYLQRTELGNTKLKLSQRHKVIVILSVIFVLFDLYLFLSRLTA